MPYDRVTLCDFGYCDLYQQGMGVVPRRVPSVSRGARAALPTTGSLHVNITPYIGNPTLTLWRRSGGPSVGVRRSVKPSSRTVVGSVKWSGLAKSPRRWAGLRGGWFSLQVAAPDGTTRETTFYWAGDKTLHFSFA